jgi:hypothetical protein
MGVEFMQKHFELPEGFLVPEAQEKPEVNANWRS